MQLMTQESRNSDFFMLLKAGSNALLSTSSG